MSIIRLQTLNVVGFLLCREHELIKFGLEIAKTVALGLRKLLYTFHFNDLISCMLQKKVGDLYYFMTFIIDLMDLLETHFDTFYLCDLQMTLIFVILCKINECCSVILFAYHNLFKNIKKN